MDDKDKPFAEKINPDSLQVKHGVIEASVSTEVGERYQFIRNGFYAVDPDTTDEQPVFNRIIGLRSSFQSKANS
jgi:glutaminyl-tRNA synthetase